MNEVDRSENRRPLRDFKVNTMERLFPNKNGDGLTKGNHSKLKVRVCILSTKLSSEQAEMLHRLQDKMNKQGRAQVSTCTVWSDDVTHVIAQATLASGACLATRTMKYFLGLAGRRWILCFDWVQACLKEGMLVDEEQFLVQRDQRGAGAAILARSDSRLPLFGGMNLVLCGAFSKQDFQTLITLGGGVVLDMAQFTLSLLRDRECDREKSDEQRAREWVVLCYSDADSPKAKAQLKTAVKDEKLRHRVMVKNFKWLLDCLSHYSIRPDEN